MSEQKPKGVGDVKITQKDVDDFFNSIHTDALVDSIKMSYKPKKSVLITYKEYDNEKAWSLYENCIYFNGSMYFRWV